jgi:CBS domain-containing protein
MKPGKDPGPGRERAAIPAARDLMETHVQSVGRTTPLLDVHRLFAEEEISGAPVLDEDGALVGVITSSDLVRSVEEERDTVAVETTYFRDLLPYSSPDWSTESEDLQDRLRERRAEDAMTTSVLTVAPDVPAPEIARRLREHRVHRVFVTDGGRLVGVISAFDLLRLVEDMKAG